jgi:6-pyruvoyltetrahydropterin/6-carboxytetrahydropterin synthase
MYRIEKRFTFPMGHRLSKHDGRCFSMHGHNFTVLIGLKSETLDDNDMVIDFADLKEAANQYLDELDHCLLLNKCDSHYAKMFTELGMRVMTVDHDPTAEKLSENIFVMMSQIINNDRIEVEYVTVFENENSKATYSLE